MRLYRPPVIGPRAVGIALVAIGVTAFVLLGLLAPVPAGAQMLTERCVPAEAVLTDHGGVVCDLVPESIASESIRQPVVTQDVAPAQGHDFLFLAIVIMAGGLLLETRRTPER